MRLNPWRAGLGAVAAALAAACLVVLVRSGDEGPDMGITEEAQSDCVAYAGSLYSWSEGCRSGPHPGEDPRVTTARDKACRNRARALLANPACRRRCRALLDERPDLVAAARREPGYERELVDPAVTEAKLDFPITADPERLAPYQPSYCRRAFETRERIISERIWRKTGIEPPEGVPWLGRRPMPRRREETGGCGGGF